MRNKSKDKEYSPRFLSSVRVTYITLTALLILLYAAKLLLIIALLKEDYDSYGGYETGYMLAGALPSLISAVGMTALDLRFFRRLTVKTIIAAAAAEILCLMEFIQPIFFWCAALSDLAGLAAAVMIIYDHASYKERTARAERIAEAERSRQAEKILPAPSKKKGRKGSRG